ncbi:hypothetical protein [Streptomyces sp. TRM68367]|uniref:hypothetical protein n=1 Tax=Streptomyces sp. TRM68367 TaxID=2758415 RepID=UPI0037DC4995
MPNNAARQLVTRRTGVVAVVATQPVTGSSSTRFFDCLLRGIRRELTRHGAQPVLLFPDEPDDYPRVGDFLGGPTLLATPPSVVLPTQLVVRESA